MMRMKRYLHAADSYSVPLKRIPGPIGGSASHEFTALSDVGESEIAYCERCEMAATTERAASVDDAPDTEAELPMEKVVTPGTKNH